MEVEDRRSEIRYVEKQEEMSLDAEFTLRFCFPIPPNPHPTAKFRLPQNHTTAETEIELSGYVSSRICIEFLSQLPIPTPAIIENESFNSDKDICFGPSGPT